MGDLPPWRTNQATLNTFPRRSQGRGKSSRCWPRGVALYQQPPNPFPNKHGISEKCLLRLLFLNNYHLNIMKLDQFSQFAAFKTAHELQHSGLFDSFLNGSQGDELREQLSLKRLQFDTHPQIYSRVESVCALLECSKREFLEMAVWEACEKAESVFGATYKDATGHEFGEADSFYSAQVNGAPAQTKE